jgi:hypothetical protein
MTWYQYVEHISENKSPIGSIEVPFDRGRFDAQSGEFSRVAIHF